MMQENKYANVNTADFVYWMWLFSSLAQIACIEIVSWGTIYMCESFTGTKPAAERPPHPHHKGFTEPYPNAN